MIAGGRIDDGVASWLVVKVAPGDGRERWRRTLTSTAVPFPSDQLEDLAAGRMEGLEQDDDFAVVKLRGSDGEDLWRFVLDDPAAASDEGAVDAGGDVVAAGRAGTVSTGWPRSWLFVKLRGADGSVAWTQRIEGSPGMSVWLHDVRVTPTGDVVAVGITTNTGTGSDFTAVKLSGSDGSVLWRTDLGGSGTQALEYAQRVALDAAGDGGVIAGGGSRRTDLPNAFTVARFDAATGTVDWRVVLPGPTGYGHADAVTVDGRGDVWVAGRIEVDGAGRTDAFLAKIHPCGVDEECHELEHSYGAEVVVQQRRDGGSTAEEDFDEYFDVRMGDQNAPVLVGVRYENHPLTGADEPHTDFLIERVSESGRDYLGPNPFVPACADGLDNDGDGLVDVAGDPGCESAEDLFEQARAAIVRPIGGRKMALKSQDPALPVPPPGSVSDPRLAGAVLELVDAAVGNSPASAGYRYRDARRVAGPCRAVDLRPAQLTASCASPGITFSLDEPSQGTLSGRLHLAGGDRVCTEFGGRVLADSSTTDGGGVFSATDAPPPAACDAP